MHAKDIMTTSLVTAGWETTVIEIDKRLLEPRVPCSKSHPALAIDGCLHAAH